MIISIIPITQTDTNKLFRYLATREKRNYTARSCLVLYQLLWLTGIRIEEAISAKWSMLEEGELHLPDRDVLLPLRANAILEAWKENNPIENNTIFDRTTVELIENEFQNHLLKCSLDDRGYTIESFRKSCENMLRLIDLPEWFIKQQLGL